MFKNVECSNIIFLNFMVFKKIILVKKSLKNCADITLLRFTFILVSWNLIQFFYGKLYINLSAFL